MRERASVHSKRDRKDSAGGVRPMPVRRCRGADRDAVQKVYAKCLWGSVRPEKEFFARLERAGAEVYCAGNRATLVYAAIQVRDGAVSVNEILGDATSAPGFLLGLAKRLKVGSISVRLPDFANPMREMRFPYANGHSQTPVRQLQLVNLPSVLMKVRDTLEAKMSALGWHGSVCLCIPERSQCVTLARRKGGNLTVQPLLTEPCLDLNWCAAARLVFGGLPGEFDGLRSGLFEIVPEILPLEWFFYPADFV